MSNIKSINIQIKRKDPFQNIGMVILLGILMNCLKTHNAV